MDSPSSQRSPAPDCTERSTLEIAPVLDALGASDALDAVRLERTWRHPPQAADGNAKILVSRWTREATQTHTLSHAGDLRWHCISVNLRASTVRVRCAGMLIFEGRLASGAIQIAAPGVAATATYEGACDVLHLFVSQDVLAQCYIDQFGHEPCADLVITESFLHNDQVLKRLGEALAMAQSQDARLERTFTESVALAIAARIVAIHVRRYSAHRPARAQLPQWRLRRALEYIDANIAASIGLTEIALSTGVTRTHFAAQFRRTTGLRVREYLLRRRVEFSQELLRQTQGSILDVAKRCGFRSQAHFTTVFKRFVGDTPHSWRVRGT